MNTHLLSGLRVARPVACALLLLAAPRPVFSQAVIPAGFEDVRVAAISSPTSIAVVPGGRLLVGSQFGQVYVIQNGALLPAPALNLSAVVCNYRERGLLGLAVDPAFASNHFIYVSYIFNKFGGSCEAEHQLAPVGRVSRFVLNDNNQIDPASQVVLLDNVPSPIGVHNLDDVEFGRDGYLYVTVGDGGCDYASDSGCFDSNDAARDMHSVVGKILRITRDGAIPPDNPFTGTGTARCNTTGGTSPGTVCREIFATGLRNPWRIAFDPNASGTRFFINDVGQDTWEEIDEGLAGADYGWHMREGFCANGSTTNCSQTPPAGLTNPVFAYGRNPDGCSSVTGGAFVPAGVWPAEFEGAYLFGDYVCGTLFRLVRGGDGTFTRHTFVTNLGNSSATDLYFGPHNGGVALYYLTFADGGEVRRIAYVGGANRAPTAVVAANPVFGQPPLTVNFDGGGSTDPDGDPLTYFWDFGDGGANGSGRTVRNLYSGAGTYIATLTVSDGRGGSSSATVRIDVGNTPPEAFIETPTVADRFAVGDSIVLRGSATDREDGQMPASSLSWVVLRRHNTHTHPFLPPTTGNNVTFPAPGPENLGAGGSSYLEVHLTATDSAGRTTTVSRNLLPRTVRMDFLSDPTGATLRIDGEQVVAPTSFTSWVNYNVPVEAASQTGSDGIPLVFQSWSDGGAASHSIRTPATDSSYTARFTRQTPPGGITATASSIENAFYPAADAIDGDLETRWSSQFSDPQWIALDLGATANISRVVLHWEAAYGAAYMIQVSDNGSAWTTVFQTTTGNGGVDDIPLSSARGRHVRMFGTVRGTEWGYSIREFQVFTSGGTPGSTPFGGTPKGLPGTVELENFDEGGEGVAYHDLSPGNIGGEYRTTDVDVKAATDTGGGYRLGWVDAGEWLKYTVNVATAGTYNIEVRVASGGGGGTFHVEVNGANVTGPLTVPNTGGWQAWTTVSRSGVTLSGGVQVWRLVMDTVGETGAVGNFNWLRATASGGTPGSTPYGGTPAALPGILQVENFDEGPSGVAYADTTQGNNGGQYRVTDVDIEATGDAGGGYNVGWCRAGEWLKYSVNVTGAGSHTLQFRVASPTGGAVFHLEIDGIDRTGPLVVPNTGDWQSWATVSEHVVLSAGPQQWRLVLDSAPASVGNFNYIQVVPLGGGGAPGSTPFGGTAATLPGTVELENFDVGGEGVAYHDLSAGNTGGEYRATDVDVKFATDTSGGYRIGWADAGEWLNYTVNVGSAGTYSVEVRVASGGAGGTFHLEVNGSDVTGPLAVPNTGGWQAWSTVARTGVTLSAGVQVWRLVMDTMGETGAVGNFNWLRVTPSAGSAAIIRGPYLQQVTDTSAIVVWTTRSSSAGAIRYAQAGGSQASVPSTARLFPATQTGLSYDFYQHEARLTSLTQASRYTYDVLVGGTDVTPGQDALSTASGPGTGSVRFIAFGDSGMGSLAQRQLATRMIADTFDLAIHTGDVAYGTAEGVGGGSYRQLDDWVFGVYGPWMRSRSFSPSIGNHDDEVANARPYRDVFVVPTHGASPAYPDHSERFYSFDYGPIHVVALDTELAFQDPARRNAQLSWLDADLGATSRRWRIVYLHRPPYSAGSHHGSDLSVRNAFAPIFERHNVQLVLAGHEHDLRTIRALARVRSDGRTRRLRRDRRRRRTAVSRGNRAVDGAFGFPSSLRSRVREWVHAFRRSRRTRRRRVRYVHDRWVWRGGTVGSLRGGLS